MINAESGKAQKSRRIIRQGDEMMGLVDKLLAWAVFGFLALVMIMSLCMIIYYGQMIFSEIRYEKERRMKDINENKATTSENSGVDDKQ